MEVNGFKRSADVTGGIIMDFDGRMKVQVGIGDIDENVSKAFVAEI